MTQGKYKGLKFVYEHKLASRASLTRWVDKRIWLHTGAVILPFKRKTFNFPYFRLISAEEACHEMLFNEVSDCFSFTFVNTMFCNVYRYYSIRVYWAAKRIIKLEEKMAKSIDPVRRQLYTVTSVQVFGMRATVLRHFYYYFESKETTAPFFPYSGAIRTGCWATRNHYDFQ